MTQTRDELLSPMFLADPHAVYARLRSEGPVHRVEMPGGMAVWLVTRYDDVRRALTDPRLVKKGTVSPAWFAVLPDDLLRAVTSHMTAFDPPDHTRLRRLVAAAFTHRRTQELRPRIQEIADELLDAMVGVDGVDVMEALAFPLATRVIFELIGVSDDDQALFLGLSDKIVSGTIPPDELAEAVSGLTEFIRSLIEEKRAQEKRAQENLAQENLARPAEDLLSAMIAVRDAGDRLSEDELTSTVFLLLIAGQVTTVDLVGNGVYLLLSDRSRWEAVRDERSLLPAAIEEFLRYETPIDITGPRMTTEPVDFGGTVVPAGEVVLIGLSPANRDSRRFADADRFDLARTDNQHLSFGHGIHHCLGAPLARLEAHIAFSSLMDRFPDLAMAVPPESLDWRPTFMIRGPARLPVTGTTPRARG